MSETTPVDADELNHLSSASSTSESVATVSQPSPTRLPKLLLLAAVALVALAAVAFALLQTPDAGTPGGSLSQMTKAIRSGDWGRVQRYIDVEAVAAFFVDTTLANAMGGDSPDGLTGNVGGMGGAGNAPGSSGSGLAGTMKDVFVGRFKESVKQTVEARGKTSTGEPSALLLIENPTSVEYVGDNEALATVQVPTDDGDTQEVVVRMIRDGDHWRIMALENFADLMSSVS